MPSSIALTLQARSIRVARADDPANLADPSSLRELLSGVAHDLNGALNTLILNIELLDATGAAVEGSDLGAARWKRALAAMRRAAREAHEIVDRRLLPAGRAAAIEIVEHPERPTLLRFGPPDA